MTPDQIAETIDKALASAGMNPRSGALSKVTQTIQKALESAGLMRRRPSPGFGRRDSSDESVVEKAAAQEAATHDSAVPKPVLDEAVAQRRRDSFAENVAPVGVGTFTTHTASSGSVSRDYKLYIPGAYRGEPMPLIVMLHGCKQNPDDFAVGTQMNELAEARGFLVAYPEQTSRANGSNCWNWFETSEQLRDGAEPKVLAGIAKDVGHRVRVDEGKVFVAGLSAGAAMAVILGATYPEVFCAVGAHSGLPRGAAHDVASAFMAMQGATAPSWPGMSTRRRERLDEMHGAVPTIVFHGDSDRTVTLSNGTAIVEGARAAFAQDSAETLRELDEPPVAINGRQCTVTRYLDSAGHPRVEKWVVEGAGHAWFGGDTNGSYADAKGPNASAEMVRFFFDQ